jgi:ion channel-forming bestrophin family protein
MHTGHTYDLGQTLRWSQDNFIRPALWAFGVTSAYAVLDLKFISLPWLPVSLIGVAVAFYLGFKNSASYDRTWEARKIYGAIVNASRSWAFSARDLVTDQHADKDLGDLAAVRTRLVHRHVAWMDALRHQLRKIKTWEHCGPVFDGYRRDSGVAEFHEDLREVLTPNLSAEELDEALAQINPAARLLANQSRDLAALRRQDAVDGFGHTVLQELLIELMTQQGKAERIKNFPFPRQYATVNRIFAMLFAGLVPFGMLNEFDALGTGLVWLTIPFSAIVGWVFLTTDQIGDWSENPFEGLANDVPITSMTRGIERDVRQMIDETELPEPRPLWNQLQF